MAETGRVEFRVGEKGRLVRDIEFPDECPRCRQGMTPAYVAGVGLDEARTLIAFFVCPRSTCAEGFLAYYEKTMGVETRLESTAPLDDVPRLFPQDIENLSPEFAPIFNQAAAAEAAGLNLICGMGYRKALEFLVKDFCKHIHREDQETVAAIDRVQLGPCIENYVEHKKVKEFAKRATWLGNDETHYVRKWQDKDVSDLKKLLELTIHWVESELIGDKLLNDMPEGKR